MARRQGPEEHQSSYHNGFRGLRFRVTIYIYTYIHMYIYIYLYIYTYISIYIVNDMRSTI